MFRDKLLNRLRLPCHRPNPAPAQQPAANTNPCRPPHSPRRFSRCNPSSQHNPDNFTPNQPPVFTNRMPTFTNQMPTFTNQMPRSMPTFTNQMPVH
jgi:hypothetical protein